MNDNASYRQYLQYHALNNPGAARRAEAQALLNQVGDDGKLNGNFLMGQKVDRGWFRSPDVREQTSNGYTASTLNRSVNPWWKESYSSWRGQQGNTPNKPQDQNGGGNRASDAQLSKYDQNNTCAITLIRVHCSYSPLSKDCINI